MAAIATAGLTKRYDGLVAVDELDLTVAEGEVFGFLGPNGAGKSTTINMLLDFVRPTAGSATVLGYDAQTEADAISPRIGILPEGFDVYPRLTGRRHVEFAIETKDATGDPDDVLDRVGLDPEARSRPAGDYSTGMRQRLAMGMALVGDPDLLIMDEPSSGLDPHGIREMQELVREATASGTTVFFSSHILQHVEAVCDRVGVLNDGELIAVDTIEGLRDSIGGGATMTVTLAGAPAEPESSSGSGSGSSANATEIVAGIDGVTDVTSSGHTLECSIADPAAKAAVVTELDASGATIRDLRIEDVSLESLFATLTNGDEGDTEDPVETETADDAHSAVDTEVSR